MWPSQQHMLQLCSPLGAALPTPAQAALHAAKSDKGAMVRAAKKAEAVLRQLVELTLRPDLSRIQRTNLETCITVHMHQKEVRPGWRLPLQGRERCQAARRLPLQGRSVATRLRVQGKERCQAAALADCAMLARCAHWQRYRPLVAEAPRLLPFRHAGQRGPGAQEGARPLRL